MLELTIEKITEACDRFVEEEIDFEGLKSVFSSIPDELWLDSDAARRMMEIPFCNEDIYDISINNMNLNISEFVCNLIPEHFWNNKDGILAILDLICEYNSEYSEYLSTSDFEAVFDHVTENMWEDRRFAIELVTKVTEKARFMEDLGCVDELIPESFFKDEHDALYVVSQLCDADNRNADDFCIFPEAAWQYPNVILWILSNLEDELLGQSFTMYPTFVGSNEDYIASLIEYIPDALKSDKSFILELLGYDYFGDAFDLIYDWIDQSLWADKEFVISLIRDVDSDIIKRADEGLFKDENFMNALDEIYDLYEWGCELFEDGEEVGVTLILYAAENGNADALFYMAELYREGDGVEENPEEALKFYKMAAENGSSDAQIYLAEAYRFGRDGFEKNFSEAIKWYKIVAEDVNSDLDRDTMESLGFIYYYGDDVEQDYNEAYYWFEKCEGGYWCLPEFVEADMSFYVTKDYQNAFSLYCAAASQGVEEAVYKIGEMYYYGLGVEQDYTKALECLKYYDDEFDEDDFDFAPAKVHRMLGEMYLNGWGVEQNTEEAEKLFRAAKKGKDS